MAYPKRKADRVAWWENQVRFSRSQVKPLFDACNVLVKQYFNEATTAREEGASDGGGGDEEHVRRTKSGLIYGWIDQSLANMLDRNPVFQTFPETKEAAARIDPEDASSLTRAQGAAKIINYRYRETHQKQVDERVALDAFIFPYGGAKIGYTVDFDMRTQEVLQEATRLELDNPEEENSFLVIGEPVMVTEHHDHQDHIESHTSLLQSPEFMALGGDHASLAEQTVEAHIRLHQAFGKRFNPASNVNVKREQPFAVHWPADMILTDTLSMEGPQDARWIAFGWELPLEEVEANPNYRVDMDKLVTHRMEGSPDKDNDISGDGFEMVRGWEIWAKNFPFGKNDFRDVLVTIAEGCDTFLQEEDEWPYDRLEDYPLSTLVFQTGAKKWFHKPPLLMAGGDTVQSLVNEVLDGILSVVRKQKNLWLVDPSAGINKEILSDILTGADGSIVEVPGLAEAGERAIMPLPFLDIPPTKNEMISILQNIFDRSAGTPQPVQLPKTDTATEASIMEKRNSSRENRRSSLLSAFQIDKARKMWDMDTQFKPERLFLLDRNADQFLQIDSELAKGEYLISMDVTSHATAISVERSQWMDLLNLFAGLTPVMMETFGMPPNLPEVARRLLVRGFDEKVVEEVLPMLDKASQMLKSQDAVGPGDAGMPGQPPGGPNMPGGNGTVQGGQGANTQMATPEAQMANEAIIAGRRGKRGIGPLFRDNFNRDIPSPGKQEGEGVS